MSDEIKTMLDKSVSEIGIKRTREAVVKTPYLSDKLKKEILDYLNILLSRERENKLSNLLGIGERKIYLFSDFIKSLE